VYYVKRYFAARGGSRAKRRRPMTVRAKMKCWLVQPLHSGDPDEHCVQICLMPVYNDGGADNASWSKYTPNGEIRLSITNPDATAQFAPGKSYYVDFTPAD
jgi:hypothetical protein